MKKKSDKMVIKPKLSPPTGHEGNLPSFKTGPHGDKRKKRPGNRSQQNKKATEE